MPEPKDTLPTGAMPTAPDTMPTGAMISGASPMSVPPAMPTNPDGAPVSTTMPTLAGNALTNIAPPSMPDRYELQGEIARGGMGRVVEALDTVLGRMVAVKEALALDADSLARFQRETKITARLEHPSIVPVHDAGTTPDGMPYYVMRKISGQALEVLVAQHADVKDRLGLIRHLADASQAVAHAHERGIVHRDIKPSNILVGELGETIVIDWGLAKVIGESEEAAGAVPDIVADDDKIHTRVGIVFGTPGFMAPEQLRGFPVDERCDVYALGATLYHMLARKPPHHSKTADEMMRKAVNGPPESIGTVVLGVPREVVTIIDKALAHDVAERYQNARELAEDLQRYITGQIVASHHYTTREKLARFVRKHLATIIAASIGLVALAVIGTIAIVRVVEARDKAEYERGLAVERADQLALGQARILIDSDPTRAVALLRPLVANHWREARSIATGARSQGVPWSIAVAPTTGTIRISNDGTRAVLGGSDGSVRIVDLVRRTQTTVADLKANAAARFADDDRKVVAYHDKAIAIVDLATSQSRAVTAPSAIVDLEIAGPTIYWIDDAEALWSLDLATGTTPVQIETSEQVTAIATSPNGRWVTLAGLQHLLALDRTTDKPPVEVSIGVVADMEWARDSKHMGAIIDDRICDVIDTGGTLIVDQRQFAKERLGVRSTGEIVYSAGPGGVAALEQNELSRRKQLVGTELGLYLARDATLVVPAAGTALHVLSTPGDRIVNLPFPGMNALAASPTSPYVVGAFAGRILVWNLDDIQARKLTTEAPIAATFGDRDHVVAIEGGAIKWYDLTKTPAVMTPIGTIETSSVRAFTASSIGAIVIDEAGATKLVVPGGAPASDLGQAIGAKFFDENHVVLATDTAIRIYDIATHAMRELEAPKAKPLQLGWGAGNLIAATYRDQLWRYDVATSTSASIPVPAVPTSPPVVLPDGTVLVAIDKTMYAWPLGGSLITRATAPAKLVELAPLEGGALAFDGDGHTYLYDGTSDRIEAGDHPLGSIAAMAKQAGLVVTIAPSGGLELVDPRVKQHWTLAEGTFAFPKISTDGTRVLATSPAGLLVWTVPLPASADATARFLDQLTNAHAESGMELTWP